MVEKRPNFAKSDSSYFSPGAGLCKQEQTKQQQCFHTFTARFLRNDTKSCAEDLSCSAPRDFHYFFIFFGDTRPMNVAVRSGLPSTGVRSAYCLHKLFLRECS